MRVFERIRNLVRLAFNIDERRAYIVRRHRIKEKKRLRHIPRFSPASTDILGEKVRMVDTASFLFIYGEVFEQQIYKFKARSERPRIIDGGANIGLSVLYFKRLYPASRITAFEPDESVFAVLKENLAAFGYNDVECVGKALWSSETALEFLHQGADGGRVAQTGDTGRIASVQAVSLRPYLAEHVDLLKLDIEGAEAEVLKDCADLLRNVEYLFVEYHSFADQPQSLNTIIDIMAGAGFRLHIHPPVTSPQPFYRRGVNFGMDMQLNIFGFRD